MPRLQAKRDLEEGKWRTADQLYDLVLAATEDEEQAAEAFRKRRHAELRSGATPE